MRGIAPLKTDASRPTESRRTFNRFFYEENSMIHTNTRRWRDWMFWEAIELHSLGYWVTGSFGTPREQISFEEIVAKELKEAV